MNTKEKNFISAVVYLHDDGDRAVAFCRTVASELDAHFAQYDWWSWMMPVPMTPWPACGNGAASRLPR